MQLIFIVNKQTFLNIYIFFLIKITLIIDTNKIYNTTFVKNQSRFDVNLVNVIALESNLV